MNKSMRKRYGGQRIERAGGPVPYFPDPVSAPSTPALPPIPPRPRNRITDRAIFWICSGESYLLEARLSARSVFAHMPDLPRVLYTPDPGVEAGDEFDELRRLPPRVHPGQWFLESTRYLYMVLPELPEYLVWATGDTYCCHEFSFIFDILQGCDWASTPMPGGACSGDTTMKIPAKFAEPTICVMGLRNTPRLHDFVGEWYGYYKENKAFYTSDQPALRAALWMHRKAIRFQALPKEWLSILAIHNALDGPAYWLHGRPGACPTYQRAGLMAKWAQEINRETGKRVWRPR